MPERFDIAVIGRALWDEWVLPPRTGRAGDRDRFGGSAANIAVHLAHLGFRVTLVASFGTDWRSRQYLGYLEDQGVDVSFAVRSGGPMVRCRMSPPGGCELIGDGTGYPGIGRRHLAEVASASRAVFFSEVGPMPGEVPAGPAYWAPQRYLTAAAPAAPQLRSVVARGWRAVFLNQQESRRLALIATEPIAGLSARLSATTWIVTNQDQPTEVSQGGVTARHPVPAAVCRVPIGGGDAVAAGVCAADLRGWPVAAGVRLGHALAGRVIAQIGCQLPLEAVRQVLDSGAPWPGVTAAVPAGTPAA